MTDDTADLKAMITNCRHRLQDDTIGRREWLRVKALQDRCQTLLEQQFRRPHRGRWN